MNNNTWLELNKKYFDQIKRYLTECEYKPEFDNFPIIPIQTILNGAELEIRKLQLKNISLNEEVLQLRKIIEG